MYHTFCTALHYTALERVITAVAEVSQWHTLHHIRVESIIIDFNYIIWSTEHFVGGSNIRSSGSKEQ